LVLDRQKVEGQIDEVDPEVSAILQEESRVPWRGLFRCFALGVVVLLCSLFKGGYHDSVVGVTCGNPMYALVLHVSCHIVD
jgi:hypothetical protein